MNRPTRFYSNKQERQVAKKLNGKQTANSGATKFQKGDVQTEQFLIECKTSTTEKKTFTIHKDWLLKNQEEAFAMGKMHSALCFDFGDNQRFYALSEREFQIYQSLLQEEK